MILICIGLFYWYPPVTVVQLTSALRLLKLACIYIVKKKHLKM